MGRAIAVALSSRRSGLRAAADLDVDPREGPGSRSPSDNPSFDDDRTALSPARTASTSRRPPLDSVDVVTPFRRVVIAAEIRALAGDRRFGQRDGLAVAARYPRQVSVHAEFTFHPQNTLVLVPRYAVALADRRAAPDRAGRYGGRRRATFPRPGTGALPMPLGRARRGAARACRDAASRCWERRWWRSSMARRCSEAGGPGAWRW